MKYANQVAASTGIDPALGDDVERSIIADNTLSRRDSDHNGFVETSMSTIAAADSQC